MAETKSIEVQVDPSEVGFDANRLEQMRYDRIAGFSENQN